MKEVFSIRKIMILLLAALLAFFTLSGRTDMQVMLQKDFDATGYVRGLMDYTFKGDYSEYLKLTDDSEGSVSSAYHDGMEATGQILALNSQIQIISEDVKKQFTDITEAIYLKSKYEVKKAVKEDGGYTVEVIISPMNIFDLVSPELKKYTIEFNKRNDNGEFAELTEEQFEDEYAKGVIQIFRDNINKIEYGADISVPVHVQLNEDKKYFKVSDVDLQRLTEAMLTQSASTQ